MKTGAGFLVLILCTVGGGVVGGAAAGDAGWGYGALIGFGLGFWAGSVMSGTKEDPAPGGFNEKGPRL